MPRRRENIYKRKDGRWEGRYIKEHINGKIKYGSVYAHTYTEARAKLIEAINQTPLLIATPEITMNNLLCNWLEYQRESVKQSTFSTYHRMVNSHLVPMIGCFKPREITPELMDSLLLDKLKNGRLDGKGGLSGKTVQDLIVILKSVISYAKSKGIEVDIGDCSLKLKWQKSKIKALSNMEQLKFLQFIKTDVDAKKAGILLCLYTGLRIGEICALRWEDICLETGTLKVSKTLQRISDVSETSGPKTKLLVDTPKSASSMREIPIPSFVIQVLKELKRGPDVYFLSGSTEKLVEPRTYENIFKSYTRQSGIAQTNFHTLRHTFATRCIECGMDVKSLSEILGHSDIKVTLNTYVHPTMNMKRAGMEKLAASYF